MSTLIFTIISAFVSFITSLYFLYQWRKQKPKNNSTLAWGLAFLVYSCSHALSGIINSDIYQLSSEATKMLTTYRFVFVNVFFLGVCWGTLRLISRSKWIIYSFCIGGFLLSSLFVIYRNIIPSVSTNFISFYSYMILLPSGLFFMAIFLILYGILIAEQVTKKRGIFLIIVSWFLYSLLVAILPSMTASPHFDLWFAGRAFSTLILLIGFIIMDYESRQAFKHLQEDKNNHHHFK